MKCSAWVSLWIKVQEIPNPKIFFGNFFKQNFFRIKFFLTKIFLGPKFFLRTKFFLGPKFFWDQNFFGTKIFFWTKTFFWTKIFSDLPGQMSPWQLESVQDIPWILFLKFGQNRVSSSWDIADIEFVGGRVGVQSHFRFQPPTTLSWGCDNMMYIAKLWPRCHYGAGRYFPRGSVGIPHRNCLNLTGNIDQNIDDWANSCCSWEFWTNWSPKTDLNQYRMCL